MPTDQVVEESGMMWQQSPDLIQWQLDTSDVIIELEHNLKGEVWNPKKKVYEKRGEAVINEDGVKSIITDVAAKLNKNIILSNLNEADVYRIAEETRANIARKIFLRYEDFGIKKANFDTIVQLVDHQVFCALKRAYNEGERRFLGKTQSRVEKITTERNKGGRGSWIPFFGGGKD